MLVKYHGNGNVGSPLVALEYEEIKQTIDYKKTAQKLDFLSLFKTKSNRWRIGIVFIISGRRLTYQ